MPDPNKFNVENVRKLVGGSRNIEVIEVRSQGSRQMLLDDFINYYKYVTKLFSFFTCWPSFTYANFSLDISPVLVIFFCLDVKAFFYL